MGTLMIKCPNTGCEISTGIQTDRVTFRHTPVFFARTLCPICQTQHEWFAKSAWVREPNVRGEQPLNLALIDRRPPAAATHSFKSSVITAIVTAAAIAAGFVAGSVALDAFASARPSALVRLSENAAGAPEANRAAKSNRLRVSIPVAVGTATEPPHGGDDKPVEHCEPVGSPIAGAAILRMPPRRCFA